jgi:hypothetical protein
MQWSPLAKEGERVRTNSPGAARRRNPVFVVQVVRFGGST